MSTEGLVQNEYSNSEKRVRDGPLRVCVYGSSSPRSSKAFLDASRELGAALAKRGHVCVNGGGLYGCMGALNEGALQSNGEVIGAIHERWFPTHSKLDGIHAELAKGLKKNLIVVGGDTLTERKKALSDNADCFIAVPGGTGTWDELWEVVSERSLKMNPRPVALLNVNGYYDGFVAQMEKAHECGILYTNPKELLAVFSSVNDAIDYVEKEATYCVVDTSKRSMQTSLSFPSLIRRAKKGTFASGLCCGLVLGSCLAYLAFRKN
eukprot:g1542.t1